MQIELTCSHGHRFHVDQLDASEEVRCPECHSLVDVADTQQRSPEHSEEIATNDETTDHSSKSLWAVMHQGYEPQEKEKPDPVGSETSATSPDEESAEEPDEDPAVGQQPELTDMPSSTPPTSSEAEEDQPAPKSLWSLMGGSTAQTETAGTTDESEASDSSPEEASIASQTIVSTEPDSSEPETARPTGLWNLMGVSQTPAETAEPIAETDEAESGFSQDDFETADEAGDSAEWASADEDESEQPVAPSIDVPTAPSMTATIAGRSIKSGLTKNAIFALVLGFIAVPLSALGMRPEFWAKLPATVVGLLAMVLGMLAVSQIRTSRGKVTGAIPARLGMVLGLLGIFLGPVHFNSIGEKNRVSSSRDLTLKNMEAIGIAVNKYHDAHQRFPAGGIFGIEEGKEIPIHGWMSALLPYMGHQQVYNRIDFSQPYDAPDNHPAMSRQIPQFFAAGVEQHKNAQGLAVAHFAGIGGEVDDPERGYLPMGIFNRNSIVSQDEIIDGLSQTLVAGEIANFFPSWGSPENWRTIGEGLNKDYYGFGNADDTGALFLKADGSVRFFSNKTSVRILEKLSTRAGEEPIPKKFR